MKINRWILSWYLLIIMMLLVSSVLNIKSARIRHEIDKNQIYIDSVLADATLTNQKSIIELRDEIDSLSDEVDSLSDEVDSLTLKHK